MEKKQPSRGIKRLSWTTKRRDLEFKAEREGGGNKNKMESFKPDSAAGRRRKLTPSPPCPSPTRSHPVSGAGPGAQHLTLPAQHQAPPLLPRHQVTVALSRTQMWHKNGNGNTQQRSREDSSWTDTLSPSATLSPKDLLTTAINELGRGKPDFSYLDKIAASCSEKAGKAGNDATIT